MWKKVWSLAVALLAVVALIRIAFDPVPPPVGGAPMTLQAPLLVPDPTLRALGIVPNFPGESAQMTLGNYYYWYVTYEGDPLDPTVYRHSAHLTPEMIERLERREHGERDPFLCLPLGARPAVTVGQTEVRDGRVVGTVYAGLPEHYMLVEMERRDGLWLVADVICGPVGGPGEQTAEQVAMLAYADYLGDPQYIAEGRYRESAYLAPEFVATLDAARDGEKSDPFVLLEGQPERIGLSKMFVEDDTARVAVIPLLPEHPLMEVRLERRAGRWQVTAIRNDEPGPVEHLERYGPLDPSAVLAWPAYHNADLGVTLHHPPGWEVEEQRVGDQDVLPFELLVHLYDGRQPSRSPLATLMLSRAEREQVERFAGFGAGGRNEETLVVAVDGREWALGASPYGTLYYLTEGPAGRLALLADNLGPDALLPPGGDAYRALIAQMAASLRWDNGASER